MFSVNLMSRGQIPSLPCAGSYRSLVKATHPDVYHSSDEKYLAQSAFRRLIEWFEKAEEKVKSGRYGRKDTMILKTSRRYYEIEIDFREDRLFNYYPCSFREKGKEFSAMLRITRDPREQRSGCK